MMSRRFMPTLSRLSSGTCRPFKAAPAFRQDILCTACADAAHPQRPHLEQLVQVPHTAGSLHLNGGWRMLPHEREVFEGGATCSVARRRLHPVRAHSAADLAKSDFLVVIEVAVLEDHFHLLTLRVRQVRHGPD